MLCFVLMWQRVALETHFKVTLTLSRLIRKHPIDCRFRAMVEANKACHGQTGLGIHDHVKAQGMKASCCSKLVH